jgi:hypothetical protein
MASFSGALDARQRVLRTRIEISVQQESQQGAAPSLRELEIAAIVDPAMGCIERRAPKILANRQAKRQIDVHPESMMLRIDLRHPKREFQMKGLETAFAADLLSDDRRPGWIDAEDTQVEHASPSGRLQEEPPYDADRRIDDGRRAAQIRHGTPSPVTDTSRSA